jgi:hypothetical protein
LVGGEAFFAGAAFELVVGLEAELAVVPAIDVRAPEPATVLADLTIVVVDPGGPAMVVADPGGRDNGIGLGDTSADLGEGVTAGLPVVALVSLALMTCIVVVVAAAPVLSKEPWVEATGGLVAATGAAVCVLDGELAATAALAAGRLPFNRFKTLVCTPATPLMTS